MLSHLWRQLGADEAVFAVTAHESWDDANLASLTMTRGDGNPSGGVATATATITVAEEVTNSHDQQIEVALTSSGADLVAAACGNRTAAQLAPRWFGRIGQQTTTDYGDDAARSTTLAAADWMAELARAAVASKHPSAYPYVPEAFQDAITRAALPAGVPATLVADPASMSYPEWDEVDNGGVPNATIPWSDLAGVLTVVAGNIVAVHRDGTPTITNLARLVERAGDWSADTAEPLTRRQCVAPCTWEQPVSNPAVVKWTTLAGGFTIPHETRVGVGPRTIRDDPIDVSAIFAPSDLGSLPYSMSALAHRLGGWAYTVPQVTVDLLELLTSTYAGDREQAGQLLTMEPFDPIALSYDWPDPVIGLYYVTALTETVTPDSWTMTLELAPTRHVTGEDSPPVPGRTWDTAYPRTTEWDDPPTTTTWDNAPE